MARVKKLFRERKRKKVEQRKVLCRKHRWSPCFSLGYSPFYYLNFLLYNSNKQFFLAVLWPARGKEKCHFGTWKTSRIWRRIIRTFLLAATSKYGPFRLTSASVEAAFLLPDKLLGLFKLLLECWASMAKSLFCLDESRCEPCTVKDRMKNWNSIQLCVFSNVHSNTWHLGWISNPCTQLISPTFNFIFNTHNLLLIKWENSQPPFMKLVRG